jgi:N-acetylglucosaminyldiphosphoundecaprenol N-acetyl-beta-D-mannosaminyltransferase
MIPSKPRITFFGAGIDPLTMGETLDRVERIIENRQSVQHVVINVAKLVMMQKDTALREAVNACGLINADGAGIVWGARLLGFKVPERVAGIDLFENLVRLSAEKGYRPYFFGARPEVVEKVARGFREQYPSLDVAGYRDGYYRPEEEADIARQIREAKADILFVAMSSPKKEFFLKKHLETMAVPLAMGVGGSFDVFAGVTRRAPLWMQKCGLEWFYRFSREPGRMWKRYLVTNVAYFGMLVRALIHGRCE